MAEVKVIQSTDNPITLISTIAGVSYNHENASEKRVRNCAKDKHLGVFEHAIVTVRIEGISRACLAQLTRHRLFSFNVQSQRYCKSDNITSINEDWYTTPHDFFSDDTPQHIGWRKDVFEGAMRSCAVAYQELLKSGAKPEDARAVLPQAAKTTLYMTGNMREYFNFFNLRDSNHAQYEIRELSSEIQKQIRQIDNQWSTLMDIFDEYIKKL